MFNALQHFLHYFYNLLPHQEILILQDILAISSLIQVKMTASDIYFTDLNKQMVMFHYYKIIQLLCGYKEDPEVLHKWEILLNLALFYQIIQQDKCNGILILGPGI